MILLALSLLLSLRDDAALTSANGAKGIQEENNADERMTGPQLWEARVESPPRPTHHEERLPKEVKHQPPILRSIFHTNRERTSGKSARGGDIGPRCRVGHGDAAWLCLNNWCQERGTTALPEALATVPSGSSDGSKSTQLVSSCACGRFLPYNKLLMSVLISKKYAMHPTPSIPTEQRSRPHIV